MLMKKIIYFPVITFLIVANMSCTKEAGVTANPVASQSSSNTQSADVHYIGEHFGGGIIFFLDNSGKHGLIAAFTDFEEASVWSRKDTINGANATAIGKGSVNTNKIFKIQGSPAYEADSYAANECLGFVENGYQDWYLPSKDELNELYKQKNVVGGFQLFTYWSSSEANVSKAWLQNFGSGLQSTQLKIASYSFRPVRKF